MKMYNYVTDTCIGELHYVWEDSGSILLLGPGRKALADFESKAGQLSGIKRHKLLEKEIAGYLEGRLKQFSVKTRLAYGSKFFRQVLETLRTVGYGKIISYRALAEAAGYPRAWRAVGTVMSKNPLMIIIPCHRVIASSGQIGNFGAGPEVKKFLLDLERSD